MQYIHLMRFSTKGGRDILNPQDVYYTRKSIVDKTSRADNSGNMTVKHNEELLLKISVNHNANKKQYANAAANPLAKVAVSDVYLKQL